MENWGGAPAAPAAPAAPTPGGSIMPASLIRTESGGNWNALNGEGYGGRGQFGDARLMDAYRAGVLPRPMTGAEFSRQPPEVQQAVENWHFGDIDRSLDQFVGVDVDGPGPIPPLTQDSIRAVAHLGGIPGARRFIESGGRYNPADSNGTNLSDYAMTHAGVMPPDPSIAGAFGAQGGGMARNASTGGLLSTPQTPDRPPSIWDRLEGRPGLGWLADPDRRNRMLIAMQGMTLRPNQGIIDMATGDLEHSRDAQEQQRMAAQLAQMPGGEQYAAMMAAGFDPNGVGNAYLTSQAPQPPIEINGQLVDPVTGQVVGDYRDTPEAPAPLVVGDRVLTPDGREVINDLSTPDTTDDLLEYDAYRAQEEAAGRTPKSIEEWDISRRSASRPETNVSIGPDGGTFSEESAKLMAQNAMATIDQGAAAQRGMGNLLALESALQGAPQGMAGGLTLLAGKLGLPVEGASEAQLANAIVSALVPTQRPPGSGPMSDADLALFKDSLPSLINQPGGNQMILSVLKNVAEYDIQRAQIAQRLVSGEITPQQAFNEQNALPHPIPAELLARLQGGTTGGATPPLAGAPGPGNRIRFDANGNRIEG